MKRMTAQEAAQKWEISLRRVQDYCKRGKIPGAERFGRNWVIPADAARPADGRTKEGRKEAADQRIAYMPMPRKTPFLHMTDLYSEAGGAERGIESLADNPEAQTLLAAEIAYSRGDIDKVYETAQYLLERHSGFYAIISAGMLLALCAIWRGDLIMWRRAKVHIVEAPAKTEAQRDIVAFSITAVDSMLYDVSGFPEWFKIGCFEPLHPDSLPAAKVFYAKYLYAAGYAVATRELEMEGVQGLSLMTMIPFTLEPMISQAVADRSLIAEIYLRMICATVYHTAGNDAQAIRHIDRAIELALPDRLYGLLAEYGRVLGTLLEQRLRMVDEEVWERVHVLYRVYNEGWTRLSGSVRGKQLTTLLSRKEREVAKLAAFGMKNAAIANALHMSVSAVKQAINNVSNKTGVSREEFAAVL